MPAQLSEIASVKSFFGIIAGCLVKNKAGNSGLNYGDFFVPNANQAAKVFPHRAMANNFLRKEFLGKRKPGQGGCFDPTAFFYEVKS
jgi:hypothetical protein